VTASFGVSCFPQPAQDAEQLLNQADQAMYQAKKGGRNTVRFARQG
jgi:diguanylate cyclase (GGDEF)-like protein